MVESRPRFPGMHSLATVHPATIPEKAAPSAESSPASRRIGTTVTSAAQNLQNRAFMTSTVATELQADRAADAALRGGSTPPCVPGPARYAGGGRADPPFGHVGALQLEPGARSRHRMAPPGKRGHGCGQCLWRRLAFGPARPDRAERTQGGPPRPQAPARRMAIDVLRVQGEELGSWRDPVLHASHHSGARAANAAVGPRATARPPRGVGPLLPRRCSPTSTRLRDLLQLSRSMIPSPLPDTRSGSSGVNETGPFGSIDLGREQPRLILGARSRPTLRRRAYVLDACDELLFDRPPIRSGIGYGRSRNKRRTNSCR